MDNLNNIFIYIAIFCIIFFSYLFVQLFLNGSAMVGSRQSSVKLPAFFSVGYWLFSLFSVSIGTIWKKYQPVAFEKMQKRLTIANIKLSAELVFTSQVLVCIVSAIVTFFAVLFLFAEPFFALVGMGIIGFCGFFYPKNIVDNMAQSRQESIIKSLPFAIDLLASAMKSGLDFSAAVRYYVANERKDLPLAQEFSLALRDMELGKTRIEALDSMAKKIQSDEFTSFISAIIHGTEVGASIVETLKVQGAEMRRVRFNVAERKAARAPSIMILPIALFIMPAFFMVIAAPIFIKMQATGGMGAIFK